MRFRADFLLVVFFCAIALLYCRFSLHRGNRGKVAGKKSIEALKECLNARTIPTPILKNKYLHRYCIRKKQERRRTPCVVFVSAASRVHLVDAPYVSWRLVAWFECPAEASVLTVYYLVPFGVQNVRHGVYFQIDNLGQLIDDVLCCLD